MKTKYKILWLWLLLLGQVYCAKAQERFQSYTALSTSSSSDLNVLCSAVPSADGRYFACGFQHHAFSVPFIIKLDYDGSGLSAQTFGQNGSFQNMITDASNNLVACGRVDLSGGASKFCLIKENQSGVVSAYNYYDATTNFSTYSSANSVIETTVAGSSTGYLAVGTIQGSTNNQIMIVKVNASLTTTSSGNYWQQVIPISAACSGVSVIQKSDNDFVLLASVGNKLYVREFDQTGGLIGEHGYVETGHVPGVTLSGASIKNVSGGGFIIAGTDQATTPFALELNLSNIFSVNWYNGFNDGTNPATGTGIIQDASNNFVISAIEGNYATIIKTISSGSLVGATAPGYNGASFPYYCMPSPSSIYQAIDGDYVAAGYSDDSYGGALFYLMKEGDGTNCQRTDLNQYTDGSLIVSSTTITSSSPTALSGDGALTFSYPSNSLSTFSSPTSCSVCTAPSSITVNASNSGCLVSGSSVTLTASSTVGGLYYKWYNSSGPISGATGTSYSATSADNYYAKGYWDPGFTSCSATSNTVTINATPVADAGPNQTICYGDYAILDGGTSYGGVTYTWNPGSISGIAASVNPTTTTVYTLTASEYGCSATSSATVTVIPIPSAAFTYAENCSVGAGDYNFTVTSPTSGASYTWWFDDGVTYSGNIITTTSSTQSFNYGSYTPGGTPTRNNFHNGTNYNVKLRTTYLGCPNTSSDITITAGSSTLPSYLDVPTYNCTAQTAFIGTSGFGPDYTYIWSNTTLGGTTNIASSAHSATITGGSGNQTIQAIASGNQCLTGTYTATVSPFLVQNATLTWNLQTVSGVPTADFLSGETGTEDITNWTTFLPCTGATLAITRTSGGSFTLPSVSACHASVTPTSYSVGTTYPLTYTWTDVGTGCQKTSNCQFSILHSASISSVSPTASTVCVSNVGSATANVSWIDWSNFHGGNLVLNWYATSTAPTVGALASYMSASQSDNLSAITTSSTLAATTTTAGVQTYYAALCIHRSGMSDVIYQVSGPITVTFVKNPNMTLTGLTVNTTTPFGLCGHSYPLDYSYNIITATGVPTGSGAYDSKGPFTFSWTSGNSLATVPSSSTSSGTLTASVYFTPSPSVFSSYYKCSITDANGCPAALSALYWDISPDVTVNGSFYACPSSTTALTGNTSSGISSEWKTYPGGTSRGTSNTYSAPPGTYQYFAATTAGGGCTAASTPFTVSSPPALTLLAGTFNTTLGTGNLSISIPSGASSLYSSATLYTSSTSSSFSSWSATVSPGYYWVTYSLCGTPMTTNMVKVGPDCSSYMSSSYNTSYHTAPPAFYNVTSTTNLSGSTNYYLGNIDVQSGATLTISKNTVMDECSEIDIESGGTLILNTGANISGCTQWRGIHVKPGGTLTINAGTISDAITAVYSDNGGSIQINGCTFRNNVNHITVSPYSSNLGANITHCIFSDLITSSLCTPFYGSYQSLNRRMIYLEGVLGVFIGDNVGSTFSGNTFTATPNTTDIIGIEAFDLKGSSSYPVYISTNNLGTAGCWGNDFDGPFYECIAATGSPTGGTSCNGLTIWQNRFGQNGATNHPYTGIYLSNVDNSKIGDGSVSDKNDIRNLTNGIVFIESNVTATGGTAISGNEIIHNTYGIVIAPTDYPITGSAGGSPLNINTNTIHLSIGCNGIGNNNIGIVGTGNIVDQGNYVDGCGNQFDPTVSTTNSLADLIWYWTYSGGMTYWANGTGAPTSVPSHTLSSGSIYMNNGGAITGSLGLLIQTPSNPYSASVCGYTALSPEKRTTDWSFANGALNAMDISNIQSVPGQESKISVFPNPTANSFTIEFANFAGETWTVTITDMLGKAVLNKNILDNAQNLIDSKNWSPGIYDLKLVNREGEVHETRIEVQR